MLREGKDKDGLSFNWQNKCVDKDACLLKSKEEYREKNNVCNIITGVLRNDCNSFVKHTPSKNDDSHVSVGPMDGVASILHDKHRCMIYAQLIAEKVELVD